METDHSVTPVVVSKRYDNICLTLTDLLHLLCLHSIPSLVLGFGQQDNTAAVKCALISRPAT